MRAGKSALPHRVLVALALLAGVALTAGTAVADQSTGTTHFVRAARTPGLLVVDGHEYDNPVGCLTVRKIPRRVNVDNGTTAPVRVYLMPGCKGGVTTVVEPGTTATALGASVQPD